MAMTPDKARAIINQSKIAEVYEGPIPDEDEKAISEAEKLVGMARDAWNQNVRGPEVESILRIADDEFAGGEEIEEEEEIVEEEEAEIEIEVVEDESEEEQQEESLASPWPEYDSLGVVDVVKDISSRAGELFGEELQVFLKGVWEYESATRDRQTILKKLDKLASKIDGDATEEDGTDEPEATTEVEVVEEELSAPTEEPKAFVVDEKTYHAIVRAVEEDLEKDRRHVPEPPSDEAPQLPWDWTKSSDTEIQSLYSYYSLLAYYKSFVLTREERMSLECKRAADELVNQLMKTADKYDEKGKGKRVTEIESEIEADPNVSYWRRLQKKHEAYCAQARRDRNSLYKIVEQLSRFETMRQQEWQRSGQATFK